MLTLSARMAPRQIGTGFVVFGGSFGVDYLGDAGNFSSSTPANNGQTALSIARQGHNEQLVDLLMRSGAHD
jgi:hypothetical protein